MINYVPELGTPLDTTATLSVRCRDATNTAMRLLFMAYRSSSEVVFTPLHCAIVRLHLDNVMAANPLYLITDINHLERVQRLVTLLVRGLRLASFEERPRSLNCLSYELMRLRVDLILVFKISKAGIDLSPCTFFPSSIPTWIQWAHLQNTARTKSSSAKRLCVFCACWKKLEQISVFHYHVRFKALFDHQWSRSFSETPN